MQRKFSEPNTYIDGLPSQTQLEELYDDVEMSELTPAVRILWAAACGCPVGLLPEMVRSSLRTDSKSPTGAGPLVQQAYLLCVAGAVPLVWLGDLSR